MDFATQKDLDVITKWGHSFHAECPYRVLPPLNEEAIRTYLAWHIESTTACIIKTDKGMIGGVIQPALDYACGQVVRESFLWCRSSGDGLRLVAALEDWAKSRKVDFMEMSTLCDDTGSRLQAVFERRGYEALQKTYRLKII